MQAATRGAATPSVFFRMSRIVIPERQSIYEVLDASVAPLRFKKLLNHFDLEGDDEITAFTRRLKAMARDGEIECDNGGAWTAARKPRFVSGDIVRCNGGLALRGESGDDVELPERLSRRLFAGDQVRLRTVGGSKRGEAKPVAVEVTNRRHELIGLFSKRGNRIVPLRERHLGSIPVSDDGGLHPNDGDAVVVRLQPPSPRPPYLTGALIEVLGQRGGAGLEVDMAIRAFDIPHEWPDEVLRESKAFERRAAPAPGAGRRDLRALPFVTIDGSDAKDFDDAVCCEEGADATTLWVAIADVASYVKSGTAMDREAADRGNSVYFPGRVVPMLPSLLSDNLCSLLPNEDRAALVCRMSISPRGELLDYDFCKAVIHSHARLTYGEVGGFFARRASLPSGCPAEVAAMLRRAHATWRALHKARVRRNALNFETSEARVMLDGRGRLRAIAPLVRNDAHRLVEEFMICANVAAAGFLEQHHRQFLYRVHQGFKKDGFESLDLFLRDLGFSAGDGSLAGMARVLEKVDGHEHQRMIIGVILRSLARAVYTPVNTGHFGLALESYAHFTSPIRRYPDLLLHRAIHRVLDSPDGADYDARTMRRFGEDCSFTEKRADDATRDIERYYKCVSLEEHVGETFTGLVTAVTSFGLFIELEGLHVEGLLHIRLLDDDYYQHDPVRHRLVGSRRGKTWRLGDEAEVTVMRVAPQEREIDLALPGAAAHRKFFQRQSRRRTPN